MVYQRSDKIEQKMEIKEKAIIEAAREIFARDGFTKASIKNIAGRAGIATGTVYLYFDSKELLFIAMMNELYQELLETIKEARKRQGWNTVQKLSVSLQAAITLFAGNRQMAELVILQAPADPLLGQQVATMEDLLTNLVRQDISEAVAEGLLLPQDATIASLAFVGTLVQVITSWLREGKPENLLDAIEPLSSYNLGALGALS